MRPCQGFTLVELTVALVIVGVLAAIAGPRFFSSANFRAAALVEETAAAIRYGQKIAVAGRCTVTATANSTVTDSSGTYPVVYALHYQNCVAAPPALVRRPQPKGNNADYVETDAEGVSLSGGFAVTFDAEGVPVGLGSPASVQIGSRQVVVEPGSGLVRVQ